MMKLKKRIAAYLCAAAMIVTSIPAAAPVTANAEVMPGVTDMGRQVAADGCVLIKNENNVLPLEGGVSISVFGRAQCNYYKCGLGSGGDVKVPYTVDILEAFRKSPNVKLNEDLVKVYADWAKAHPPGTGTWGNNSTCEDEMPLSQHMDAVEAAAEKSEVAVVIIGRTAGEDREGMKGPGGYMLQQEEENMLKIVTQKFEKVVVVLNVPTVMDMNWATDPNIVGEDAENAVDSIIYTWHGGMTGGDAAVDVLTGVVNPSGRLADTIAKEYEDYPSAETFGTWGNTIYNEDIYVGYRYFETFEEAKERVAYPFGYGLSYTEFNTEVIEASEDDEYIHITARVTNVGKRSGKETVQVYYGAPQGKLGNPAKELIAFAKTKELKPDEEQTIKLSFKITEMAPYDDSGATEHESAYVLEAGDYNIYVGDNVRNSKLAYTYEQDALEVVEQLTEVMAPDPNEPFDRIKPVENADGTLSVSEESVAVEQKSVVEKIEKESAELPLYEPEDPDARYTLMDVYNKDITTEEFVASMTNKDMISLSQAVNSGSSKYGYIPGVAAAFGGVEAYDYDGKETTLKAKYGIPVASLADGPSGIRQTAQATLLPCEAAIACTWNTDLVQRMFELEGQEMVLNHIDTLLGPGMNIHRNPIGGRNFEYYSEDPLITGKMASATTLGIQKSGATVTIKHFAANNQETDRRDVDARVSERALRQIYLKGYEIAVKEGKVRSIMTSYNPINGLWTASNYDLNTTVLRGEWGYTGMVMTDWWGDANETIGVRNGARDGEGDHLSSMIKAQNDLYVPIRGNETAINSVQQRDAEASLANNELTREELQRSAINLCNYLLKSQAFADFHGIEFKPYYEVGEPWFKVEQSAAGDPRLSEITVGGRKINTFNKYVTEYEVFCAEEVEDLPIVDAAAEAGTTFTVEQATKDHPVAIVRTNAGGEDRVYRIIFTSKEGVKPVFDNPIYANLSDIKVNGKSVGGFDASIMEYTVAVEDLESAPEITCTPSSEGVKTSIEYNSETRIATIKCVSVDQVNKYILKIGKAPRSDEFDSGELDTSVWTIMNENPANWQMEEGHLVINSERGSNFTTENNLKNQFVQSAYGDWEVEVKLDLDRLPDTDWHSTGILVMQDIDNYICSKIERGGGTNLKFTQEKNHSSNDLETLSINGYTDTVYFKLKKLGNVYTASVSPDGENYTNYHVSAYADYAEPKFVLYSGNGGSDAAALKSAFDYVRFSTDDIVAETTMIDDDTTLKLGEMEPAVISSNLRPAFDATEGWRLTNCYAGEYAVYNIDVEETGVYDLTPRLICNASDLAQINFLVYVDDVNVAEYVTQGTDGWVTKTAQKVRLTAGQHKLKVYFHIGGLELNWLRFKLVGTYDEAKLADLETAIKDAKDVKLSGYTDASQKIFKDALLKAEEAFASGTQADIDKAMAALAAAKAGLTLPSYEKKEDLKPPVKLIDRVKVAPKKSTLYVGGDKDKTTTVKVDVPQGAEVKSVIYNSSKTKYASVNKNTGKITAKKKGTTTITATVTLTNGETKDFKFKVAVKKAYIKETSVPKSIKKGKTKTLKAKAYGSSKKITWKITKGSKYAKLTKKGKFTAKKKGTVKVSAASGKIKKTFTIKIK